MSRHRSGAWALSLVGIAALVARRGRPERYMTLGGMMMEPFISSHRWCGRYH